MGDEGAQVHVSLGFLQQLAKMASEAGGSPAVAQMLEEMPGMARYAPTVDIGQPIRMLALDIGRHIARQRSAEGEYIFTRGEDLVTVAEATGQVERMTPGRFVGWVEQFVGFKSSGAKRLREGLTREDAALVLEQDVFWDALRPLVAVHTMRLPIWRETAPAEAGGEPRRSIEFLQPGYDEGSGIFTAEVLDYPMEWTWEEGRRWLVEHCEEFPWVWPEEEAGRDLMQNRSFAVWVMTLLGTYCRALFPPGTTKPIILSLGNQPGTGKTRLVEMALLPVLGAAETTEMRKDEEAMAKCLETVARTRAPYVFFDDIGGGIYTTALYQFATSSQHAGRKMGGNAESFSELNVTQVFATGNDLKFDANLARRALVMRLFLATEVRGRKFKRRITMGYLKKRSTRQGFLAACCALVREYLRLAAELPAAMLEHPAPLESFEEFTGTLSAMMQVVGFNEPLAPSEDGGDGTQDEDEMKELLVKVATAAEGDEVYLRQQLVEAAWENGLLEGLVGLKGGKLDNGAMKSFGRQLQKHRGREYKDEHGRRFRFSHRRQSKGMSYPLVFIGGDAKKRAEQAEEPGVGVADQVDEAEAGGWVPGPGEERRAGLDGLEGAVEE